MSAIKSNVEVDACVEKSLTVIKERQALRDKVLKVYYDDHFAPERTDFTLDEDERLAQEYLLDSGFLHRGQVEIFSPIRITAKGIDRVEEQMLGV